MHKAILLLLICAVISSCYTKTTAVKQIAKADLHYPALIPKICSDRYPVTGDTVDRQVFIKGDPTYVYLIDTVIYPTEKVITKYRLRVDTFYKDKTVTVVNRAAIAQVQANLEEQTLNVQTAREAQVKAEQKLSDANKTKTYLWIAIVILALLVAGATIIIIK